MPVQVYVPRTAYVLEEGGKVARPVTSYALEMRFQWQDYAAAEVQAYQAFEGPVGRKKLAELLARETPVLVSADGKKVDPFHMQVIKRGTLVLVVSQPVAAPPAVTETLPPPPMAPLAPPGGN
jgi:hypothetical protein